MKLKIRIKQTKPGVVTLSPIGHIDTKTSSTLDKEIDGVLAKPVKVLVLDMTDVDFITSAGVGIIVKTKTSLKRKGGDFAMINLQPQVEKVFEILRLIPVMEVFASREELDEYLVKVQDKIKREDS